MALPQLCRYCPLWGPYPSWFCSSPGCVGKKVSTHWREIIPYKHIPMCFLRRCGIHWNARPPFLGHYRWSKLKSFPRRKDNDQTSQQMDEKPKSPMGGWSKVKSSPREKDNNQSRLRVDRWPKSPTGGQFKVKSFPRGTVTKLAYGWTVQSKVIPRGKDND